MHGHKRDEYKARMSDPKLQVKLQKKAKQWFQLNDKLLLLKKKKKENKEDTTITQKILDLTFTMLQVNPDPLFIWNQRRRCLVDDWNLDMELQLTSLCLKRNPKAYGIWFHRKWCISNYNHALYADKTKILQQELNLCSEFLNLDERNFHCWNYRRFIVGCLCNTNKDEQIILEDDGGVVLFGKQIGTKKDIIDEDKDDDKDEANNDTNNNNNNDDNTSKQQQEETTNSITNSNKMIQNLLEDEFNFTTEKIEQNFSNGSAFHYRGKLLPFLLERNSEVTTVENELELIHNAIFTEPDDQTAWWYYQFLLTLPETNINYQEEEELLNELLDMEGGESKWILLGLYQLLLHKNKKNDSDNTTNDNDDEQKMKNILQILIKIDPDRRVRYENLMMRTEN